MRVKGHTLRGEGMPFATADCQEGRCNSRREVINYWGGGVGGDGHAMCSCGATSGHLASGGQRKQWHADHKAMVAGDTSAAEMTEREG